MKYRNKNKTFLTHEGSFKIDDNYNIIEGVNKGKHYKDIINETDTLRVVNELSPSIATIEPIKGDFDLEAILMKAGEKIEKMLEEL